LIFIAMLRGTWRALVDCRRLQDARALYLLCTGLPLPLFLALLAPFVTINPHWPAAGFLPLLLLTFILAAERNLFSRGFLISAVVLCAAVTLCMHAAPVFLTAAPDPQAGEGKQFVLNPSRVRRELLPWQIIGKRVESRLDESTGSRVLMSGNWHNAALLAFYARQPTNTFCLESGDAHNFELWRKQAGGLTGRNALVVLPKGNANYQHQSLITKYDKYHRYLDPLFIHVDPLPSIRVYPDAALTEPMDIDVSRPAVAEFLLFRCEGFQKPLP
jgi:hypothetical protein